MRNVQMKGPAGLVPVPEEDVNRYLQRGYSLVEAQSPAARKKTEKLPLESTLNSKESEETKKDPRESGESDTLNNKKPMGVCAADIKKMNANALRDLLWEELSDGADLNTDLSAYKTIGAKRQAVINMLGLGGGN